MKFTKKSGGLHYFYYDENNICKICVNKKTGKVEFNSEARKWNYNVQNKETYEPCSEEENKWLNYCYDNKVLIKMGDFPRKRSLINFLFGEKV